QAWLTLPSCLANSKSPTFARIIFCSWVISCLRPAAGRGTVPARGENRAPPSGSVSETNNVCQIKFELTQISVSSVRRIWRSHGLQPHRVRQFKLSRDPEFIPKLRDIVGLYIDPLAHAWCSASMKRARYRRSTAPSQA